MTKQDQTRFTPLQHQALSMLTRAMHLHEESQGWPLPKWFLAKTLPWRIYSRRPNPSDESQGVEFYNGNGDLIAKLTLTNVSKNATVETWQVRHFIVRHEDGTDIDVDPAQIREGFIRARKLTGKAM